MALNGIDISSWQAGINLEAVPCDFVIIKATQGTGCTNPDYARAYAQAKAAGKCLGVYHYAEGVSPTAEADYFIKQVGGRIGECILVLDWEGEQNPAFGVNDFAWCKAWLNHVASKTGVRPLLYISQSIMGRFNGIGNYGFWIAQYADMNTTGYQAAPWNEGAYDCVIRQYSSCGRLNGFGGNLDLNKFYGDRAAWNRYACKGNATTTPPSTAKPSASSQPKYNVMVNGRWLETMDGLHDTGGSGDDYAGCIGIGMQFLAIEGVGKYRVCTQSSGWLPWVDKRDLNDLNNGCAGDGSAIIAIEIPNEKIRYKVHVRGGGWLDWMIGIKDEGGSSDTYAGCMMPIDAIKITSA